MTMIARVADGLPLAATMQEDEQVYIYTHIFVISYCIEFMSYNLTRQEGIS